MKDFRRELPGLQQDDSNEHKSHPILYCINVIETKQSRCLDHASAFDENNRWDPINVPTFDQS